MDTGKIKDFLQKIGPLRLILLVLAGILLLVCSFPGDSGQNVDTQAEKTGQTEEIALMAMQSYAREKEKEIEELLEQAEGMGDVKVMLTLASSEERVPMQDGQTREEEIREEDQAGGKRTTSQYESQRENVLVQKEGEAEPYVVQIYAPSVEGVAVVAEGADSGERKKEIIETIQALFHIEAHKIKVMKMK